MGGDRRVLIIDDDEDVRATLRRLFRKTELEVREASLATLAVQWILDGERFGVILCDLNMPAMTGIEFHDRITMIDPVQASAIVFITGAALTPETSRFFERTKCLRFEKPFDFFALRDLLASRLG